MKNSIKELDSIEAYYKSEDGLLREVLPEECAAIYGRISGKHDSFSIESQLEACKQKALAENLIVYRAYYDEKSARQIHFYEREGFKNLLADLEAGMFKTVIITRRDRLSRRIDDFMQIRKVFEHHGIRVIYSTEGDFGSSDKSYITSFIENMLMAISTLEPEYISERADAGRKHLREQGIYQTSKVPFGYIRDNTEKHKYHMDKNQALIIKKIFQLFSRINAVNDAELKKQVKNLIENLINDSKITNLLDRKIDHQLIYRIITKPIYAGLLPISAGTKIDDLVYIDSDSIYKIDEEKLITCTNFKDITMIDYSTWKTCIINYIRAKFNSPVIERNFFF